MPYAYFPFRETILKDQDLIKQRLSLLQRTPLNETIFFFFFTGSARGKENNDY